ncbi:MAG: SLC26A/SulP transporter family protein [Burkholderiales bacterium]
MNDQTGKGRATDPTSLVRNRGGALSRARSRMLAAGRDCLKDAIAGLVASVVLIANIVSFGALMFPGDLSAGIPIAIWAMLIGSCIGGVWIALATSLPPLATGIDSPTGAVLVLLSAAAASGVVASGGSPRTAVQTVMLIFTAATFISGALLFGLGACRWGSYFRFVPYFVVGGFLAATGWFLIAGGVRMTTGRALALGSLGTSWTVISTAKLASAVAALMVLLAVRRWNKSAFAMPAALLMMWLAGVIVLRSMGLSGSEQGWYLPSLRGLTEWSPFEATRTTQLTWSTMVGLIPELLAVTIVALISLVTKVSSIEVARQAAGNLDREFRAHGIANLLAVPFGGIACSLQTGTSRLLEHAGGATRMSGVVSALVLGAVGIANFNLPGLIPIPIVAGLVFYLGYTFIVDALSRPYSQRAWLDLLLAIGIMIVCIEYGYLVGVLAGLVCACVLFAISYARLGVVRRHVTRALFASHVDRSVEVSEHLREIGDAIQLYWLAGYIFFGSSERVFERIRGDIESLAPREVAYVILDFGMVSGADSSAVASLAKLRNFCDQQGTTLVYCSLSPANRAALELGGFFGGKSRHRAFADLNLALAWCEDRLVAKANLDETSLAGFEPWLQHQLGPKVSAADLVAYLERKDADGPQILYREGEPADTVDLVAVGNLAIDIATDNGESLRVRRIMTHTVLGEMGFFRHSLRSATVSSDGPAIVFTMSRSNFERMRRERPDLASAFDDFIMRVLADRIDFANRAVAALSG